MQRNSTRTGIIKMKSLLSLVSKFDTGSIIEPQNYEIKKAKAGLINEIYFISNKLSGERYVVRKLNTIFNLEAINNNSKLLEKAQKRIGDDIPSYWQPVYYYDVLGSTDKVFSQDCDNNFVVMKYISGDIKTFSSFSEVPFSQKQEVAYSFGEGLKIFEKILSHVPQKEWMEVLPHFHNSQYHYNYLQSILAGKEIVLNLSRDNSKKVIGNKIFLKKYYKRIKSLLNQVEKRKDLVSSFEECGLGVIHGDPKIDNAIFRRDEKGRWRCVSIVDLDTLQVEPMINDLGDALRSAGNLAGEQPKSLDLVKIDKLVVEAITKGYLEKTKRYDGLVKARKLEKYAKRAHVQFLFMLGIRFLADALIGNKYFRLKEGEAEDMNLYRAEVQFRALGELLNDMS